VTIQTVFDAILGQAGVIVLLLVILWSGWKGYWVFGRYFDAQAKQIERLENRLDRAVGAAESGVGMARQVIRQAEGRDGDERPS
jgi:hypothetical protein